MTVDPQSKRLRVYVAGPMSVGDPMENVFTGLRWGQRMVRDGLAPYIPHLDAFMMWWDRSDYEHLLDWDFAWVAASDALFRIPGVSPGADREVALAKHLKIPVYKGEAGYKRLLAHAKKIDRVAPGARRRAA